MDEEAIAREIAPAFVEDGGAKTDVVVLGCTHYPLLLDKLDAVAPWPVAWLDPAPAIGRRIANVLAEAGHIVGVGAKHGRGEIQFTSGQSALACPSPSLAFPSTHPAGLRSGLRTLKRTRMIPRYSRPQMAAIWSDQTKYEIWLEIETLAAEAMEQLGQVPAGTTKILRERGGFNIARIDEIEREVKHDVIAFLTSVAEHTGPGSALHASGHDILGCARHLPLGAADPRLGHPAGRS